VDWSRQNQQNIYSLPFYFDNRTANRTAINTIYRLLDEGNQETDADSLSTVLIGAEINAATSESGTNRENLCNLNHLE